MADPRHGVGPEEVETKHGSTLEEIRDFSHRIDDTVYQFFGGCPSCIAELHEVALVNALLVICNNDAFKVAGLLTQTARDVMKQFGRAPEGAVLH